jgi:hypothetical protein
MDSSDTDLSQLMGEVEAALDESLDRPLCLHRLCETLTPPGLGLHREERLELTRQAAVGLVERGRAQRAFVSAIAIGAHCEDEMFWSALSPHRSLEDFGPAYEPLALARRLSSHIRCHGL